MNHYKHYKFSGGGLRSPALCCLLLALAALLCSPGVAAADHPDDVSVTASLGEEPSELEGVTVQLKDTQGPQLVVENTTDRTLEVYNARDVPFLRISSGKVEANRKAETFYDTFGPEGTLVPEEAREATVEEARSSPDWAKVRDEGSWGWFDHRLQTEGVEVPEDISNAEEAAEFGSWEVPVNLGETETSLEGSYRYEPEPKGTYIAGLTSEPELPEVEAQLSQGYGGATALLLRNGGEEPVTILDGEGDPAIEIGPDEVRVNANSPVGREADRTVGTSSSENGGDSETGESSDPEWKTVAGGSSFTWQDPRLRPPGDQSQPPASGVDERQEVSDWNIPIETSSGESSSIEGVIRWEPLKGGSTSGSGESSHEHSGHDHPEDSVSQGGEAASQNSGPAPEMNAATIVPAAGLLIAVAVGGSLLYRRWQTSR